ncbi:hypothetical protein [Cellulomonas shaoxiangyii]|uniref:Uncharacterized protein n=1 Tax=Cellulomonas shaoxiangyii TaxID=2566013 RepID=A0A4P7SGU0_9CELL|nr:hypothetical protein [Cellulomonas shaoxiangyii]QCB92296.1 hypothetical protein E5225_00710 [Cellulomonas shaoxiangyii]TGY85892.1 hypothetical protein E5226_04225 [Cellulomonas shaoxiangyii]
MPEHAAATATAATPAGGSARWLVVASRRPAAAGATAWDDAAALARAGQDVVLVVTDDVVVDLLRGAPWRSRVAAAGVRVLVDAAAARRRGVLDRLDVPAAEPPALGALLADPGLRTVWR